MIATLEVFHLSTVVAMLGITQIHWVAMDKPLMGLAVIGMTGPVLILRFIIYFDYSIDGLVSP